MFQCSRCSHVNISSEQFRCENCGKGTTEATGMENTEKPDFKNINFGSNEPEESAVAANEVPRDSNFQILKSALASLGYFSENHSIVSSEAAAHTIETTSSTLHGCDKLYDTVRFMDLNSSSALAVSKDFNMTSGSRNQQFLKDTDPILDEKRKSNNIASPKKSKSEICAATFHGISNEGKQFDEAMKIDATFPITNDNSHLPSTSKELPRTISDAGSHAGQAARSFDNILAVPGPSGIQRNVNSRNMCVENPKSTYSKKFCNICEKEYIEGYSHKSEHKCIVCNKRFQCRTLYNEHLLDHPDDFIGRCWVCTEHMRLHLNENAERTRYKCCACCEWGSDHLRNFIRHNRVHKPEIHCKKCRKEYDIKDKEFHYGRFPCSMCPVQFECKTQLEEHYDDHKDDLREKCILCNDEISNHTFYKCCKCNFVSRDFCHLQCHLVGHAKVRLYKCDKCERRYITEKGAKSHLEKCNPLLYRCEICRLRFSSDDSLHEHLLAKHFHA